RGVRFVRTNLDGGAEEPIVVKGDWHFTFSPIGSDAVGPDGRIVLPVTVSDSWYWAPAVLDPRTGEVRRIPVPFSGDVPTPAWTSDGKVIAVSYALNASLWRFRPEPAAR